MVLIIKKKTTMAIPLPSKDEKLGREKKNQDFITLANSSLICADNLNYKDQETISSFLNKEATIFSSPSFPSKTSTSTSSKGFTPPRSKTRQTSSLVTASSSRIMKTRDSLPMSNGVIDILRQSEISRNGTPTKVDMELITPTPGLERRRKLENWVNDTGRDRLMHWNIKIHQVNKKNRKDSHSQINDWKIVQAKHDQRDGYHKLVKNEHLIEAPKQRCFPYSPTITSHHSCGRNSVPIFELETPSETLESSNRDKGSVTLREIPRPLGSFAAELDLAAKDEEPNSVSSSGNSSISNYVSPPENGNIGSSCKNLGVNKKGDKIEILLSDHPSSYKIEDKVPQQRVGNYNEVAIECHISPQKQQRQGHDLSRSLHKKGIHCYRSDRDIPPLHKTENIHFHQFQPSLSSRYTNGFLSEYYFPSHQKDNGINDCNSPLQPPQYQHCRKSPGYVFRRNADTLHHEMNPKRHQQICPTPSTQNVRHSSHIHSSWNHNENSLFGMHVRDSGSGERRKNDDQPPSLPSTPIKKRRVPGSNLNGKLHLNSRMIPQSLGYWDEPMRYVQDTLNSINESPDFQSPVPFRSPVNKLGGRGPKFESETPNSYNWVDTSGGVSKLDDFSSNFFPVENGVECMSPMDRIPNYNYNRCSHRQENNRNKKKDRNPHGSPFSAFINDLSPVNNKVLHDSSPASRPWRLYDNEGDGAIPSLSQQYYPHQISPQLPGRNGTYCSYGPDSSNEGSKKSISNVSSDVKRGSNEDKSILPIHSPSSIKRGGITIGNLYIHGPGASSPHFFRSPFGSAVEKNKKKIDSHQQCYPSVPLSNHIPVCGIYQNRQTPIKSEHCRQPTAQRYSGVVPGKNILSRFPMPSPSDESSIGKDSQKSGQRRIPCNCKKSKCLKLYCECFAAELYCEGCNCSDCSNLKDYEVVRTKAIKDTKAKNPNAFKPRITIKKNADAPLSASSSSPANGHNMGCRCKKSACLKKYCECFEAGVICSSKCKCIDCQNFVGSQALIDRRRKIKDHKGAEMAMRSADEYWKGKSITRHHTLHPHQSIFASPPQCGILQHPISMHPIMSSTPDSHRTSHHYMGPPSHILIGPPMGYSPIGLPPTANYPSNELQRRSTFSLPPTIGHTSNLTKSSQPIKTPILRKAHITIAKRVFDFHSYSKKGSKEPFIPYFGTMVPAQTKITALTIYSFLSNSDIFNASLVCHIWSKLSIDRELWKL